METNRLKQFCAIIETGSMVKASVLLHLTHSALSKSMKILQDEIGIALLRTSGRGIVATEHGMLIYHRAKKFLDEENNLFRLNKNTLSTELKIGSVEIFLFAISAEVHRLTSLNHCLSLLDMEPGKMEQLIANHELDYGISYAPFPHKDVEILEIGKYYLSCYFLKGVFQEKNISELPFVVPAQTLSSNPLGIKERDGWLESIYPRHKKYSVNLLSTALELTLQGLCAIYIPDFVAKKINQSRKEKQSLIEFPLPKKQKNLHSVFLLRHKDRKDDAISKQLIKIVKEIISPK